ncbi:hypothetical protein P692DRAFT_20186232 [Suillus brevipes Sb2]|nr:hypothetical protein P692DRAFT_20186232 [Suillus brevipes Sb2]
MCAPHWSAFRALLLTDKTNQNMATSRGRPESHWPPKNQRHPRHRHCRRIHDSGRSIRLRNMSCWGCNLRVLGHRRHEHGVRVSTREWHGRYCRRRIRSGARGGFTN